MITSATVMAFEVHTENKLARVKKYALKKKCSRLQPFYFEEFYGQ
jgi:hypothetical protein